jgi:hypothetical protein
MLVVPIDNIKYHYHSNRAILIKPNLSIVQVGLALTWGPVGLGAETWNLEMEIAGW